MLHPVEENRKKSVTVPVKVLVNGQYQVLVGLIDRKNKKVTYSTSQTVYFCVKFGYIEVKISKQLTAYEMTGDHQCLYMRTKFHHWQSKNIFRILWKNVVRCNLYSVVVNVLVWS